MGIPVSTEELSRVEYGAGWTITSTSSTPRDADEDTDPERLRVHKASQRECVL